MLAPTFSASSTLRFTWSTGLAAIQMVSTGNTGHRLIAGSIASAGTVLQMPASVKTERVSRLNVGETQRSATHNREAFFHKFASNVSAEPMNMTMPAVDAFLTSLARLR